MSAPQTSVRELAQPSAWRGDGLLSGPARLPALHARLSLRRLGATAQLQAVLRAIERPRVLPALPIALKRSTPRAGPSAGRIDARSRPGAECKPARGHRTRSTVESALATGVLDERDSLVFVTDLGTDVNAVTILGTVKWPFTPSLAPNGTPT